MSSRRIRRRRGQLGAVAQDTVSALVTGHETPWKNKRTGRLKKGWRYGPDRTVVFAATGEVFNR